MSKKPATTILAVATTLLFVTPRATALSESARTTISENCSDIKQVLRVIQHEDSRSRIAVGAVYESISAHFITPLNIRLVANNLGNTELITLQSEFASTRSEFSSKFIEYSRSYERLLATDCQSNPDNFYKRLEETRALRGEIYALTTRLSDFIDSVPPIVTNLEENIDEQR